MDKLKTAGVLLFIALVLSSCYESEVPLSRTGTRFDERLLGSWSIEDGTEVYRLERGSANEYRVDHRMLDEESGKWESEQLKAFVTDVGGVSILNLQSSEDAGKYVFLKYQIEAERIKIWLMDDDLFQKKNGESVEFRTSSSFYRYVKRRLSNEALFGKDPQFLKRMNDQG